MKPAERDDVLITVKTHVEDLIKKMDKIENNISEVCKTITDVKIYQAKQNGKVMTNRYGLLGLWAVQLAIITWGIIIA